MNPAVNNFDKGCEELAKFEKGSLIHFNNQQNPNEGPSLIQKSCWLFRLISYIFGGIYRHVQNAEGVAQQILQYYAKNEDSIQRKHCRALKNIVHNLKVGSETKRKLDEARIGYVKVLKQKEEQAKAKEVADARTVLERVQRETREVQARQGQISKEIEETDRKLQKAQVDLKAAEANVAEARRLEATLPAQRNEVASLTEKTTSAKAEIERLNQTKQAFEREEAELREKNDTLSKEVEASKEKLKRNVKNAETILADANNKRLEAEKALNVAKAEAQKELDAAKGKISKAEKDITETAKKVEELAGQEKQLRNKEQELEQIQQGLQQLQREFEQTKQATLSDLAKQQRDLKDKQAAQEDKARKTNELFETAKQKLEEAEKTNKLADRVKLDATKQNEELTAQNARVREVLSDLNKREGDLNKREGDLNKRESDLKAKEKETIDILDKAVKQSKKATAFSKKVDKQKAAFEQDQANQKEALEKELARTREQANAKLAAQAKEAEAQATQRVRQIYLNGARGDFVADETAMNLFKSSDRIDEPNITEIICSTAASGPGGPSAEKTIKVHSCLLQAFFGEGSAPDAKERDAKGVAAVGFPGGKLDLTKFSDKTIQKFKEYLYFQKLDNLSLEDLVYLHELFDYFKKEKLRDKCFYAINAIVQKNPSILLEFLPTITDYKLKIIFELCKFLDWYNWFPFKDEVRPETMIAFLKWMDAFSVDVLDGTSPFANSSTVLVTLARRYQGLFAKNGEDPVKAKKLIDKLSTDMFKDNVVALHFLGECHAWGRGFPANKEKSKEYLQRCLDKQSYAPSLHLWSLMNKAGDDWRSNVDHSTLEMAQKAEAQGYFPAIKQLGTYYYCRTNIGDTAQKFANFRAGIPYFQKCNQYFAFNSNYFVQLQTFLGNAIQVTGDKAEGLKILRIAAHKNCNIAQYLLGSILTIHTTFPELFKEGIEWYCKAAKNGRQDARQNLNELAAKPRISENKYTGLTPEQHGQVQAALKSLDA